MRHAHARTVADHEATVAWAKSLDKELQDSRDAHARTIADHEATVAWAKALDRGLAAAKSNAIIARDALVAANDSLTAERDVLVLDYNELVTERDGLTRAYDRLIAERDAMLASRSWRLTGPLRISCEGYSLDRASAQSTYHEVIVVENGSQPAVRQGPKQTE